MSEAVATARRTGRLIFTRIGEAVLVLAMTSMVLFMAGAGIYWFTHDRHLRNITLEVSTTRPDCDDKFPL